MSLDDVRNPHHAAALERGEGPRPRTQVFTSEHDTVAKIARWLADSEAGWMLSERALLKLAGWLIHRRGVLTEWFGEIAPEGSRVLLQQQAVSHYSSEDQILERLHELRAEEALLYGYLRDMKSVYADQYDPDRLGEREDDRRISAERADEAASQAAPQIGSVA